MMMCKMLVVQLVTMQLDLPGQCLATLLMRLIQINWQWLKHKSWQQKMVVKITSLFKEHSILKI